MRRFVLFAAVALVALEVLLQIGALIAFSATRESPAGRGGILCVGDSYTFGIGASAPSASYPGRLETILAERGVRTKVVNTGRPGQNSRDVLLNVASQITADTETLCVLIGTNDAWTHPASVTTAELSAMSPDEGNTPHGASFVWRWRTGRLFALIFRFAYGSWSETGDVHPSSSARVEVAAATRAQGFRLIDSAGLLANAPAEPLLQAVEEALRPAVRRFWEAMNAQEFQQALAIAREAIRDHPESPDALTLVVHAGVRLGNADEVTRAIDTMKAVQVARPSPVATECLMQALLASGRVDEAADMARARVAEEPRAWAGWNLLQSVAFNRGWQEEFLAAALVTIRLAGESRPEVTASILRNYARAVASTDQQTAAVAAVSAFLLDGQVGSTRLVLRKLRAGGEVGRARLEAVLAQARLADDGTVRSFKELMAEVFDGQGDGAWRSVLHEHLLGIGRLAQARGMKVLILSYPFYSPEVEAEQLEAAEQLGAPFVRIRERFDAELKSRPRSELFVLDGHCNDAGYSVMAELVAGQILSMRR